MTEKRNYYREWLGIDDVAPNHYQLLGLDRSIADPEQIQSAARQRLEQLKSVDPRGAEDIRRAVAQRIKAAYAILSHPERRRQYDAELSGAPLPMVPTFADPPAAPNKISIDAPVTIRVDRPRYYRRSGGLWIWLVLIAFFVVAPGVLIAVIWFTSDRSGRPVVQDGLAAGEQSIVDGNGDAGAGNKSAPHPATSPGDQPPDDSPQESSSQPPGGNAGPGLPETEIQDNANTPTPVPTPAGDSAHAQPGFQPASLPNLFRIQQVLARLQSHDTHAARMLLEDAIGAAVDTTEATWWSDWLAVVRDVDDFGLELEWHVEQLQAAREFTLNGDLCSVIGVETGGLLFKLRGISLFARWRDLPHPVVVSLAETVGLRDVPSWKKVELAWRLTRRGEGLLNEATLREQMAQSAANGHDVAPLERLAWELYRVPELAALFDAPSSPADPEATQVLIELIGSSTSATARGSRSDFDQALEIARRSAEPAERLDHLIRALRMSIAGNHWSRCREVVQLLMLEHRLDEASVLLECARQMMAQQPLAGPAAVELVEELIDLSGHHWAGSRAHPSAGEILELARDIATRNRLRLQLNRLETITP